jgi:hypothetical protein
MFCENALTSDGIKCSKGTSSRYNPELQAPANRTLFRIASYAEIYLNNGKPRDYKLCKKVASYCATLYYAYNLPNNMMNEKYIPSH